MQTRAARRRRKKILHAKRLRPRRDSKPLGRRKNGHRKLKCLQGQLRRAHWTHTAEAILHSCGGSTIRTDAGHEEEPRVTRVWKQEGTRTMETSRQRELRLRDEARQAEASRTRIQRYDSIGYPDPYGGYDAIGRFIGYAH